MITITFKDGRKIDVELYKNVAPITVKNFINLVNDKFYDRVCFHRIIKDFMIQSGDPTGTGRGGESIWKKDFKDEFTNKTFQKAGILAMANRGPHTNGSQFFITTAPTPWLNGRHTIFGQVSTQSLGIINKLQNVATAADRPIEEQKIIKAYIKE